MQILRQNLRQLRQALSPAIQAQAAQIIASALASLATWDSFENIALYWPFEGECDARGLLNNSSKTFYLPVVKDQHMLFSKHSLGEPTQTNTWGIEEPKTQTLCPAEMLDCVIVPCVAIDRKLNRLGMGQGYYDRCFAFKKNQNNPWLIGLVYDFQVVEALQPQAWDIPLDAALIISTQNNAQPFELIFSQHQS